MIIKPGGSPAVSVAPDGIGELIRGWRGICAETGKSRVQLWRDIRARSSRRRSKSGQIASRGFGPRSRLGSLHGRGVPIGRRFRDARQDSQAAPAQTRTPRRRGRQPEKSGNSNSTRNSSGPDCLQIPSAGQSTDAQLLEKAWEIGDGDARVTLNALCTLAPDKSAIIQKREAPHTQVIDVVFLHQARALCAKGMA